MAYLSFNDVKVLVGDEEVSRLELLENGEDLEPGSFRIAFLWEDAPEGTPITQREVWVPDDLSLIHI